MSSPSAFDWHDYVVLRERNPVYRAQFEEILDRISQTPDGREMMKKAVEVSGSGKNKVEIATSHDQFTFQGKPSSTHAWGTSGAADIPGSEGGYEGKLTLDLSKAGSVGYIAPDGRPVAASLTNQFVHELFHLADPNCLPHVMKAQYKEALRSELAGMVKIEGGSAESRAGLLEALAEKIKNDFYPPSEEMKLGEIAADALQSPELRQAAMGHVVVIFPSQKPLFAGLLSDDNYPAPPPFLRSVHPTPNGAWLHEKQCVKYVDRFMLKYFGEPPRQEYGNLVEMPQDAYTLREPQLLALPTPEHLLPDYRPTTPPMLPNLPRPLEFAREPSLGAAPAANPTESWVERAGLLPQAIVRSWVASLSNAAGRIMDGSGVS